MRPELTAPAVVPPGAAPRPGAKPHVLANAPPTPVLLSPADSARVLEPTALTWQAVSDPLGIQAYNVQVSTSTAFTSMAFQNSTFGTATADTVSGLVNGAYFWRVQAVNTGLFVGPWSVPRSITVTGVTPGTLAPPLLGPPQAYTTFHPREVIQFHWSPVPGAVTYRLEVSSDPTFPENVVAGVVAVAFDNIPDPGFGFELGDNQGTFFARVFAVDANNPQFGRRSQPSNLIQYTVFYTNPIGPPPVPISPVGSVTLQLPFPLVWHHVPNPQPFGYEVQVSPDATFNVNETPTAVQLTDSLIVLQSLTAGTKFWRVRSTQGMASPTLAAVTAWSAPQTFTLSTAPPVPVSVTPAKAPLFSGEQTFIQVQLSAGVPAAGATVTLTSSNPAAAPVPATLAVQGATAFAQFQLTAGQVLVSTPVTITATLNGVSARGTFTVLPPSLQAIQVPSLASGGALGGGNIMLNGQAPASGAVVSLTSSSPAASPPATVTVPAGSFSAPFTMPTTDVSVNTPITLTASWNGTTVQASQTLTPRQPPASVTLTPSTVVGLSGSSFGRVTVTAPPATDLLLSLASSQPAIARVNNGVVIPAGSIQGGFDVFTQPVTTTTVVNITVSGGGVTLTAPLTVTPVAAPPPPTPGTPALLSPADGSNVSQPLTLDWADVTAAVSYEVQVANNSTLTPPLAANPTVAVSQATITGLPQQRLWWRVRGRNSAGVFGPFSASSRFTPGPAPAAASLSALSASPASVVGGNSAQGTVSLTSGAPAGGAVVTLTTSNAAIVSAPASVTIAAGATSATFSITTTSVTIASSVTLTASLAGISRSATLAVNPVPPPAALAALSVSPASVTGGGSATGTVTLTAGAPAGGAVVTLSSQLPAIAQVPATVTVPAGALSASFTVTSSPIANTTALNLGAIYLGLAQTTAFTVLAPAAPPPPPPPPPSPPPPPPPSSTLPAPTQIAPAADTRVAPGTQITFDWSDVTGAASYTIQVDDNSSFPAPLIVQQSPTLSTFATSTLPTTTMWWRVRANAADGAPGSWSAARRFEVKL